MPEMIRNPPGAYRRQCIARARRRRTHAKAFLAAGPGAPTELTPQQPLWYEVVTPTYYPAVDESRRLTITVIVCAYNEARLLPVCLYSLLAQTRPPDEIIVVNNAMWGAVRRATLGMYPQGEAARSNRPPFIDLEELPAFEQVCAAAGGYGERVDDPAALPAALERALHAVNTEKRQALLNVICRGP